MKRGEEDGMDYTKRKFRCQPSTGFESSHARIQGLGDRDKWAPVNVVMLGPFRKVFCSSMSEVRVYNPKTNLHPVQRGSVVRLDLC